MKKVLFESIKKEIQQVISEKSDHHVTSQTKQSKAGIYLIYVNNFSSDKILPIYIGKSKNIQKRYQSHLTELLTLNRLAYGEYKKYWFGEYGSFYNGRYKTCKIFQYMVEHKCTLDDYRMLILEEVEGDEELLDKREQYYFSKYYPAFLGFNQLNSRVEFPKVAHAKGDDVKKQRQKLIKYAKEDIKNIERFYGYGYTEFNYKYALFRKYEDYLERWDDYFDEIDPLIETLDKKTGYIKFVIEAKKHRERLDIAKEHQAKQEQIYKQALEELKNRTADVFKSHKIRSVKAYETFLNGFNDEAEKNRFFKYLNKRNITADLYNAVSKETLNVKKEGQHYLDLSTISREVWNDFFNFRLVNNLILEKSLFPSFQYSRFPLKSRAIQPYFNQSKVPQIHFTISNNGNCRSNEKEKKPDITCVDIYCEESNKRYFVNNKTTRRIKGEINYIEIDYYKDFVIRREPYQLSAPGEYVTFDESYISILSEYKNGINDYDVAKAKLLTIEEIIDDIKSLIGEGIKPHITFSESKNCFKKCLENYSDSVKEFLKL